jgi:hypothetical protein
LLWYFSAPTWFARTDWNMPLGVNMWFCMQHKVIKF